MRLEVPQAPRRRAAILNRNLNKALSKPYWDTLGANWKRAVRDKF